MYNTLHTFFVRQCRAASSIGIYVCVTTKLTLKSWSISKNKALARACIRFSAMLAFHGQKKSLFSM
jgi:hypothetical protein